MPFKSNPLKMNKAHFGFYTGVCWAKVGIVAGSFFLNSPSSYGQENVYYPNFFSSYKLHPVYVSPAYIPLEGRAEFSSGYKSLVGAFNQVSNYYFSAAKVWQGKTGNANVARLIFANEKDGPYISSPRAYANYAYRAKLADKTYLQAGLSIGFMSMDFSAPSSTLPQIFVPDANMALEFQWRGLQLGVASFQVLNSSSSTTVSRIVFQRYYQGMGQYSHTFISGWKLTAHALYRILPSQYNQGIYGFSVDYRKTLTLGALYSSNGMLSGQVGIHIKIQDDVVSILMAYNSTIINKLPRWQDNIELGLNYWIK